MKEFKNVIMLDLDTALKPNVERLATYDCILLPNEFKVNASTTIQLLYKPLDNVFYYN